VSAVSLHDLIEALANSVAQAQDQIERFQIANLSRYFDGNHRPVRVEVRVPSLRPSARSGDEDIISVPLLALIGSVRLAIKDVDIAMEVDVGELRSEAEDTPPDGSASKAGPGVASDSDKGTGSGTENDWGDRPRLKALTVDVHSPRAKDQPAMAKVTLRVQSQEPTEGLSRLMLLLNQRIGPIGLDTGEDGAVDGKKVS
jgi:Protein of unknown function (DUF2589)